MSLENQTGGCSDFYLTNGNDLGNVPRNYYDFVYCTISMQHIASYKVRKNILANIFAALKVGGKITLQMAYNPRAPYAYELPQGVRLGKDYEVRFHVKGNFASYFDDDFDAEHTNGAHDVCIGAADLDDVKKDLSTQFANVALWFSNVSNYYNDLNGKSHDQYWATDWIYLHGEKI